jgi:N-acetylneuraminic acid mutarotase
MNKIWLPLLVLSWLLVSVVGAPFADVALANPLPPYTTPIIKVISPSPDGTYSVSDVSLTLTVEMFSYTYSGLEKVIWLNYSLDGQAPVPIGVSHPVEYGPPSWMATGNGLLYGLSSGNHSIVIQGKTSFDTELYATVSFAVNTSFSPSSPSPWVPKSPMSTARFGFGVAEVNGKIYAIGGHGDSAGNSTEEYDSSIDMWTTKASMPTARHDFAIASYRGKIYVMGGVLSTDSFWEFTSNVEVYDPASDSWTTKTSMTTPRAYMSANVVNEKIYIIAGVTKQASGESAKLDNSTLVYDPASDSWSSATPIPNPVQDYASAVVDGKIYMFSGSSIISRYNSTNLTQIYNPQTDSWTQGDPIPSGVSNAAAAQATTGFATPKAIYVFGGFGGYLSPRYLVQIYFPQNDTWSSGRPLQTARFGMGVVNINDAFYVIGGSPGGDYSLAETDLFLPEYGATATPNPTSFPAVPEFPSGAMMLLVLVVFAVATIVYKRKLNKPIKRSIM